jgi:chromosome segregation protein
MGRIAALQNAREAASNAAERAGADLLKLASESQELERERGQLEEARRGALAREREAEALAAALAGRRDGALAETSQARERASLLGREADLLESERDGLAGRLSSLEEMVATHSAFDEGVRALLTGAAGVDVLGVVADCVETDSAHERAVEAFLGDRLQTLLTSDGATAAGCIRFLRDSGAGRATLLPLAWNHAETASTPLRELAGREPRVKGLVSDLYRVTGPHAEQIRASLPDGLVTESLDEALGVHSRHPGVPCVSLGGDTVRAGLVEGGRGVKGLLAPRREIREIGARLVEIGSHLSGARGQEAEQASRAEAMSAEARTLEESIHAAEKDLVAIRHDLAVAEEETVRILRKATVLETERSLAEQERSAAAVRLGEIEEALGLAEEMRASGSERLSAATSAMGEARTASETAQERSAEARSRLAALRERGVAAEAECRRLSEDHVELLGRIAAARAHVDEMERRGSELTAEIGECERLLAEARN